MSSHIISYVIRRKKKKTKTKTDATFSSSSSDARAAAHGWCVVGDASLFCGARAWSRFDATTTFVEDEDAVQIWCHGIRALPCRQRRSDGQ